MEQAVHHRSLNTKGDNTVLERVSITDPWVSRQSTSILLHQSSGPAGIDTIDTKDKEVYGNPSHPVTLRIGNGGAGYTGIFRNLAERFIESSGGGFRIGWIANHSRHSQIALLANVVQVALTYEPQNEDIAIHEGWARRVGRVFNDHFILVGPDIELGTRSIESALRAIAELNAKNVQRHCHYRTNQIRFHSRGDGSATFTREQRLWSDAAVDIAGAEWIETKPATPYEALVKASHDRAFLLTDRATFLTAKERGEIPSLRVHVEGGKNLLNPCSALVRSDAAKETNPEPDSAASFATWLCGEEAQRIVGDYGRDWVLGKPLFTVGSEDEFNGEDKLTS